MIRIDIPRTHSHLMYSGPVKRLRYNVLERAFMEINTHTHMPAPEVYEWLVENVGYELTVFRKLDQPFYDRLEMPKGINKVDSHDDWEAKNPVLDGDQTWTVAWRGEGILFTTLELATLFKLRWF